MSNKKFSNAISGKGYYIALILCAIAIGISGYLYYRHMGDTPAKLENEPTSQVDATLGTDPTTDTKTPAQKTPEDTKPAQTTPTKMPAKRTAPVSGQTVAEYSMEALSYNETTRDWRVHNGMDIAAQTGTEVHAAADGSVYTVYDDETMGTTVVISHDGGYTTRYSSLDKQVSVAPGDKVTAGQTIGKVGSTALMESALGDHVHFSVSCNGTPVDPAEFLPESE